MICYLIMDHYCRIWHGRIKVIMSRSNYSNEHFKPNLLDPRGLVSSKTLQSTIAAANNEVICTGTYTVSNKCPM